MVRMLLYIRRYYFRTSTYEKDYTVIAVHRRSQIKYDDRNCYGLSGYHEKITNVL